MKRQPDISSFAAILELNSKLQKYQADYLKKLGQTFSGFRIIENPLLAENEIAITCGSNAYKQLMENFEK